MQATKEEMLDKVFDDYDHQAWRPVFLKHWHLILQEPFKKVKDRICDLLVYAILFRHDCIMPDMQRAFRALSGHLSEDRDLVEKLWLEVFSYARAIVQEASATAAAEEEGDGDEHVLVARARWRCLDMVYFVYDFMPALFRHKKVFVTAFRSSRSSHHDVLFMEACLAFAIDGDTRVLGDDRVCIFGAIQDRNQGLRSVIFEAAMHMSEEDGETKEDDEDEDNSKSLITYVDDEFLVYNTTL